MYACPADVPNAWEVEIEGPQKFKISFAKKDLFRVLDSQPQLIQEAYVQQWTQIRNLFEIPCEVPPDSKDSVEDFLTKVEAGNHGAAVIFMNLEEGTKAKEYMERLKKNDRGYAVEGALEPSLTVMDGAVVIDTKTKKIVYCGMIVDGLVEGKGDMARGARHNSISTFCTYFNSEYILAFLHRLASLSFHARTEGGLHGFVVIAVGFENKALRAEDFRLEPRPQHLFGGHAVVGEKAAGGKGCGTQNAHPANFFGADIRLQGKVDTYRHADSQHRADELPRIQPEKDVFMVVADFFRYFDFHRLPPYSPIISLTMRSQPLMAPTSTSRLNASSPT